MLDQVLQIAIRAGREILRFYGRSQGSDRKADGSPITQADRASHQLILKALQTLSPHLPVLSEESAEEVKGECLNWPQFWLVDPLDGTKEFLKGTHEFTVNICLVRDRVPALGVVHAPALNLSYYAENGRGAWKQAPPNPPSPIRTRSVPFDKLCIVTSRDHIGPGEIELLGRFPTAEKASMGSSLKFCLVAEGQADLYPRLGPTMEWDTGAAQCVVEQAGGAVLDPAGARLLYQKPGLKNPSLFTLGDRQYARFRELWGARD
jgi:3'(2'), 5'-bisphosphate nucleotidase